MLIGEIAGRSGLSRDTIRFYEKQGLIAAQEGKNKYNNYKDYPEESLQRLFLIRRIKPFGFTLHEISKLLDLIDQNKATCKTVSLQVNTKIAVIDQKISELKEIKRMMSSLVANCCQAEDENANCPSLTK